MKKQFLTILLILGFSTPVLAQEEVPDGSVSVDFAFVSNYIFRGADLFKGAAEQRGEKYGENTGAPAFQPSITFGDESGMYFNLWGSFAMTNRADADADRVIQTSPGGSDAIEDVQAYSYVKGAEVASPEAISAALRTAIDASATNLVQSTDGTLASAQGGNGVGLPGLYKEQNGLERFDEIDFIWGYGQDTDVGTFDMGIVSYLAAGIYNKSGFAVNELYVSYTPWALPIMSITSYGDMSSSNLYTTLSFDPSVELAPGTELGFSAAVTHMSKEGMAGISHYDLGISFSTGALSIGVAGAYRENFYLVGEDGDSVREDDVGLLALAGGSTATDGLVPDPSNVGWFNSYKDGVTQEVIRDAFNKTPSLTPITYNHTTRQQLPRWVYYTSIAYTVEM